MHLHLTNFGKEEEEEEEECHSDTDPMVLEEMENDAD